jgi:hypothetical protein
LHLKGNHSSVSLAQHICLPRLANRACTGALDPGSVASGAKCLGNCNLGELMALGLWFRFRASEPRRVSKELYASNAAFEHGRPLGSHHQKSPVRLLTHDAPFLLGHGEGLNLSAIARAYRYQCQTTSLLEKLHLYFDQ